MTHLIEVTHEEARKLAAEDRLFEVTEKVKEMRSTMFVVAPDSHTALALWSLYNNAHSPKRSLCVSTISIRRYKSMEIGNIPEIHIGAIADIDDDAVPAEKPELQPVA